jgi:uncharacterized protein (DUF2236 family)
LLLVTFGTEAEARDATKRLAGAHRRIKGSLPTDQVSTPYSRGAAYDAFDHGLQLWVLGTIVQSALVAFETVVHPLSVTERDEFVREWRQVAELFEIPRDAYWPSADALDTYIADHIADIGTVGPAGRRVAEGVLGMHGSVVTQPALAVARFLTLGVTPPALREAEGMRWTAAQQRAHDMLCSSIRAAYRVVPRPLRVSPVYRQALRRVRAAA